MATVLRINGIFRSDLGVSERLGWRHCAGGNGWLLNLLRLRGQLANRSKATRDFQRALSGDAIWLAAPG